MKRRQWRGKRHAAEQFYLKQVQRAWVTYIASDIHPGLPDLRPERMELVAGFGSKVKK